MSVDRINHMARKIAAEIEQAREDSAGNLAHSDPEIWEHLFEEDIIPETQALEPAANPGERAALRELYRQVKEVIEQALMPSDLAEAFYVLEGQAPELLRALAEKDEGLAGDILRDLKSGFSAIGMPDETRAVFAETAETIRKARAVFNAAAEKPDPSAGGTFAAPKNPRASRP
ncbi:MAG: hypothetical protein GC185_08115 [Alphaproteobacteria bacterium]|nr:hypothetical protein [Alphaproteobacteria bacterium]